MGDDYGGDVSGIGDSYGGMDTSGIGLGSGGFGSDIADYGGAYGDISFGGGAESDMFGGVMSEPFGGFSLGYNDPGSLSVSPNVAEGYDVPGFGQEEDSLSRVRGFVNSPIGRGLLGIVGIANPALGSMLGLAKAGMNMGQPGAAGSRAAGSHFGGLVGGNLGQAVAGTLGGLAGGALGSMYGGQAGLPGYSGPQAGQPEGAQGGGGFMDKAIPTLAGLYAGYQGGRGIGKQIGSLSNMYGQGSPYAQALRQQLERRDAGAGRRSQYGPREVELQAQLARMASSNAPGLAALYGQQNQNRAQMLKALMFGYDQMGGLQGIRGGLQGLFGGNDMNIDTSGMGMGDISGGASADYFDPVYGG